jgi:hypothetical protein
MHGFTMVFTIEILVMLTQQWESKSETSPSKGV